ncbi:phosphatase PAP2 family protein [Ilumatobacter nonamiensis]|uniref:phosphatase PAP2 family protein n=1 Tax=Ilumatobacter nonamiensis TaxID=467093 RepID=UPI000347BDF4|nr:phosphatase PAP2 family protein [Ilumatobacter nonamiensis]
MRSEVGGVQKQPVCIAKRKPSSNAANAPVRVGREILAAALVFVAFPVVAHAEPGSPSEAMARGSKLARLEQSLGIDVRGRLVDWIAGRRTIELLAELFYYSAHVSALVGTGIALAVRCPDRYRQMRTVFVVAHVITIFCYLMWPTAPPRVVVGGDRIREGGWTDIQYAYAAFPSGHMVFALVIGVALSGSPSRRVRITGVTYPIIVGVVTLATNNHYVIDLIAAAIVVTASSVAAMTLRTRRLGRQNRTRSRLIPEQWAGGSATPLVAADTLHESIVESAGTGAAPKR